MENQFNNEKSHLMLQNENGFNQSISVNSLVHTVDYKPSLDKTQTELEERFEPKKRDSIYLSDIYRFLGYEDRSLKVFCCGEYLEFKLTNESGKLHAANFCKDRLCPMCNWRRSLKLSHQVSKVVDVLQESGYSFLFLTLTIKNCAAIDLADTVDKLNAGWRYLYHNNAVFKKQVHGTFRAYEITRNVYDNSFHPHIHVILAVRSSYFNGSNYISQKKWVEMWQEALSIDYKPVVDIRAVQSSSRGLTGAVAEVAKYSVKGSDYLSQSIEKSADTVSHLLEAISFRRLCSFTGVFAKVRKQLKLDSIENGDLVNTDTELNSEVAYQIVRYRWKFGFYALAKY
ncbi:MAG: protein rep [Sulfolobaceae archaeon]